MIIWETMKDKFSSRLAQLSLSLAQLSPSLSSSFLILGPSSLTLSYTRSSMITMWTDILTTLVTGTSKISSLMIHGTRLSLPMVWLRRAWLGAGSASCSGVAPWSLCSYRSTTSRRRRGTWTGCLCTLAWMGVSGKMEACSLALGITQGTSQHCLGALFREVLLHNILIIVKTKFI